MPAAHCSVHQQLVSCCEASGERETVAIHTLNIKNKQLEHLEDKLSGLKSTLDTMQKAGLALDGNVYAIEDEIRDIERQVEAYKATD